MTKQSILKCFHCGENCNPHVIIHDQKKFCCIGCKAVYEILKTNEACEYYALNQNPGIKNIQRKVENNYDYLDLEEIKNDLLNFSDGGISKVKFFIPAIHCSSCIWLLENLNRIHNAILYSNVNFLKKEVQLTFKDTELSLRQLVELLTSINYTPQITLECFQKKNVNQTNKQIYYKLGVAGFCFGNIMLLSFPEYFNFNDTLERSYRTTFAYINLILTLPIIFYAATGYFISALKGLQKKIITIDFPISLGVLVLFCRSTWDVISQTDVGYFDSLAGLVFFLLIGKWYQNKTYQALSFERDFKSYFPVAVNILDVNGKEKSIPLKQLKSSQRIIIRNHELIPVDSILLKGHANIDYSFVNGESTPIPKQIQELIYAGGRQMGSVIELMTKKEVTQSYLTELWNQDIQNKKNDSSLNTLVNSISQYFTATIILISLVTGVYWLLTNPSLAINTFTSVLIIACPCALALTLPFAFGSCMRIFGKNGFYLKNTKIIERLSKIDTIVFDKTGTLTQNAEFKVETDHIQLTGEEYILVKSTVRHSTHPLCMAIDKSMTSSFKEIDHFEEISSSGIKAIFGENTILIGSQAFVKGIQKQSDNSFSQVYVSINQKQKGFFNIKNTYRKGIGDVIKKLQQNYDLHLLSGDNDAELPYLEKLFPNKNQIHFNQSPQNKLDYINQLKINNKKVLMIGDGLNDAGALKESDVGISIADNIYHFSPACDAILEAKRFKSFSRYMDFSKISLQIVKVSFLISFLYNLIGLSFAVQAYLTPVISAILMPVSSVSVVAFITLTTSLLATRKKLQ